MLFRVTRHAVQQMVARDIGTEDVDRVLSAPGWEIVSTGNTRYDGLIGNRRLCVVVAEEDIVPTVVTVFWYEGDRE